MLAREGRPYFRTKDEVYYGYELIQENPFVSNDPFSDKLVRYDSSEEFEMLQYLKSIDRELVNLYRSLADDHPALGQYLKLLNTKIDHLAERLVGKANTQSRKVNLSLNGMSFKTEKRIREKTLMKLIIYTKPNLLPIVVKAKVIYSQFHTKNHYHTAVEFESLTEEQADLLSHHIKLAQVQKSKPFI